MKKTQSKAMRRRNLVIRLYVALLTLILGLSLTALLSQRALATTYVITDGDRVVTYTSFATDPAEVLGKAGVELSEHDTYTTEAVEGGSGITINRANHITVHYHGQTRMVTGTEETVGELLDRLSLDVTGEDLVSHGMEEEIYNGMELTVDRTLVVRETYTSTVPHETSYLVDPSIPEGTEAVLAEGRDGEVLCSAEVTYVNGREVSRKILSKSVTTEPVTEVVGVGTGEARQPADAPIIEDGYIILPTGEVLTYTHKDTVRATAYTHTDKGCDMVTSTGSTVRWGTVAVDPRYIPYGTRMFIMASDGSYIYGIATAEDCGGDIKGDRMDLYMPTYQQCMEFGRRRCTLYFLG